MSKLTTHLKKAVYAGSFDPFTIGHLSIVEEASKIFDEVHVLLSINSSKKRRVDVEIMLQAISESVSQYSNVKVVHYDSLIADYCQQENIPYSLRGLRNSSDYIYEENIAKINQEINPDLQTIYLRAKNDTISSSMVWELYTHGKSVQKYLPYNENYLKEQDEVSLDFMTKYGI